MTKKGTTLFGEPLYERKPALLSLEEFRTKWNPTHDEDGGTAIAGKYRYTILRTPITKDTGQWSLSRLPKWEKHRRGWKAIGFFHRSVIIEKAYEDYLEQEGNQT